MDEDKIKMIEVQADLMDLFVKYADSMDQAIAMTFKTVVDCYVAQFGREGALEMLNSARNSINDGKHDINPSIIPKIPQNLIN